VLSIENSRIMDEKMKYCPSGIESNTSFRFDHVHIVYNEQITLHQSPEWELSYVITGSGTRITGDTTEFFSSGEVVFLPPHMPHGWYFDEFDHDHEGKIENITIFFTTDLLQKIESSFPETSLYLKEILLMRHAVRFQGQTLSAIQKIMTTMRVQSKVERLLSLIRIFVLIGSATETIVVGTPQKQNKSSIKMQNISRFIVNNFQRKITLDEVAKTVGMNISSFCTFYKKMKGKSFLTDLNEYRINSSCVMLKETNMTVSDICFSVGFEDIPHFNRTFRRLKGLSPLDFRKMSRN
jgi:AraC-type DNA-binding domain-containing proteins